MASIKIPARAAVWMGLILLVTYWWSVHPVGWFRGYMEDLCGPELVRQFMAEQLTRFGHPGFVLDQVMIPRGISAPYMSWMIERDWLGAYFWMWNRDFPFQWFYFGVSLLGSYLGGGYLLKKARLGAAAAWGIAAIAVVLHVPRHFKIWYHAEHLLQHWVYWSVFLDVLILSRVFRERRYSLHLELWRGVCLLGMLGTAGYYWGPLILEWLIARIVIGAALWKGRRTQQPLEIGFKIRPALIACAALAFLAWVDWQWYLPLYEEVRKQPEVFQPLGGFAKPWDFLFPLWYGRIPGHAELSRLLTSETLVPSGWVFWIPALLSLYWVRKKKGGIGLLPALPFLGCVIVAILYSINGDTLVQDAIQKLVPFMRFFRVAVRWGLLFPPLLAAIVAVSWPELSDWYSRKRRLIASAIFLGIFALEFSWLTTPVLALPPLPGDVTSILETIRKLPGDTVLNLPFCTAGGNGVCTGEQCPQYPYSTVGACFRGWHDKKVHGLYAARLTGEQCGIYRESPYTSWFSAWRENRCLRPEEWSEFCSYLSKQPSMSAILVFPDIWTGARSPECRAEFDSHLGAPLGEASFSLERNPGGYYLKGTRVVWYAPQCKTAPAN